MDIELNITENLKDQFEHYFKLELRKGEYFRIKTFRRPGCEQ
jgi:hypothetical protein